MKNAKLKYSFYIYGIKLLLDEDVWAGLAQTSQTLREDGIDAVAVTAGKHAALFVNSPLYHLALQTLLLDPMINDIDRARAILDDYLTAFADYLPQFE